jgi:hypothetical protein
VGERGWARRCQQPLAISVAIWAGVKTLYYLGETLRHLAEAISTDLAYTGSWS